MSVIQRLDFLGVPSQDADRARTFYRDVLGLPDAEARPSRPLLVLAVLVRAHAEHVAVEGAGAVRVL